MVFKWVYLCLIALSHPRLMAPLGDHQPLSLSPFLGWIVTDQLSSGQLWWMNRSCIGWHSILKPIGASVFGSSDNGFNRWAWGLKGWSEKVGGESWLSISYKSSFSGHPFFGKFLNLTHSILPLSHPSLQLKGSNFRTRSWCISRRKDCQSMQSMWQRSLLSNLAWRYFYV